MTLFDFCVLAWIALAIALVPIQLFVTAPYGRHVRDGWGPRIPNRLGWFAMEIVSLGTFATLFLTGPTPKSAPMWVFFAFWTAHYANRSLIFPWRVRTAGKSIPVLIVVSAVCFNSVNAGLNGYYLGSLAPTYPTDWLMDPRFVLGALAFLVGAAVNVRADNRLIALRARGNATDYAIPHGGLFEYVSCPNHLGEIVQWFGFALMCWNLPALSFAIWTAANLIPRSLSHHDWYKKRFADYPPGRKAVVPFLL
jgi:3-oxo-5-alpha-steroid 4-dehydrogenase 1